MFPKGPANTTLIKKPVNPTVISGIIPDADPDILIFFFKNLQTYPAKKPAITAPKNPALVLLAMSPPIKPEPIAGFSPIENAINPANTVFNRPMPVQPTCSIK